MRPIYTLLAVMCCLNYTQSVHAQEWEGDTSTDWFDATNWSTNTVPTTGDTPFIPLNPIGGLFPEINLPLTIDFPIQIFGELSINADVSLINSNSLVLDGTGVVTISNIGSLFVEAGSNIANNGDIIIEGSLSNNGNIDSDGEIHINNLAVLFNDTGGFIQNDGEIFNLGTIMNDATLANRSTINNFSVLENNSQLTLNFGSFFFNGFVGMEGTVTNAGNMVIEGELENVNGIITNQNNLRLTAPGVFINRDRLINQNSIDNSGTIINEATFINQHTIINNFGNSLIDNNEDFINESCAIVFQFSDNEIDNIENYGIVDAKNGADVSTTSHSTGVVLREGTDVVQPNAQCKEELTIELDMMGNASITPSDIDDGSSVDYCSIASLALSISDFDCSDAGQQVVTLTITDDLGNSNFCSTDVLVIPPAPNGMACDDVVHLSVGAGCTAVEVTPDVLLVGSHYVCPELYDVEIWGVTGNVLQPEHVGQTFTITITDPYSGTSCWGTLVYEDKADPILTNCGPQEILCIQDPNPVGLNGDVPEPTIIDCPDVIKWFNDFTVSGDCTANLLSTINRVWTVTDASGNTSECTQEIRIRNVSMSTYPVACPPDIDLECILGESVDVSPEFTGYPTIQVDGIDYDIHADSLVHCGLSAGFVDDTIARCGGFDIFREWTIMDWCIPFGTGNNPFICHQRIRVQDTSPPMVFPPSNISLTSDPFNCYSTTQIPSVNTKDCTEVEVIVETPVGIIYSNGGQVPEPGLPLGDNLITYIATDECGNVGTAKFVITVLDEVPPVPVCNDVLNVSLNDEGFTLAPAEAFDDGSYDPCGIESMLVRRLDTPCDEGVGTIFDDYVAFTCCDVENSPIMIALQVIDQAGNVNECMSSVEVEDKLLPSIICPPNKVLDCSSDFTDLALTNLPIGTDNCSDFTYDFVDIVELNDCGVGTIFRTWTGTTDRGETVSCQQTIELINQNPFNGDTDILWPLDFHSTGCGGPTDPEITGRPIVSQGDCDMVVATYHDLVFEYVDDVCFKIVRKWSVVDWCQGPNTRWEYSQVIKIEDNIAPVFEHCGGRTFCNVNTECEMEVELGIELSDNCLDAEDLEITWIVDAFNDGINDNGFNHFGEGMHTGGTYPNGTHKITYTAQDGCGNFTTCSFLFTIVDCKAPTPVCITGWSINLMESGMVTVWAEDLERGSSFDNCADYEDLTYALSADDADISRTFTCENVGLNVLELWVSDPEGNKAFCETFVEIQDNTEVCAALGGGAMVIGYIQNAEHDMLENVQVFKGGDPTPAWTTSDGEYKFLSLPMHENYELRPERDDDHPNGVTTLDVVLVKKHILGVDRFTSPYQYIAADVNNTGSVTSFDMVEMRRLILNQIERFPNNTSWRFIDEDYQFLNPENPFDENFPETIFLEDLDTHVLDANFMAVKIGDLNGSAVANNFSETEDRTNNENLVFNLHNKEIKTGEVITVHFNAEQLSEVWGYQFGLQFDTEALAFRDIIPSEVIGKEHFGLTQTNSGIISTSWDNVFLEPKEALQFGLQFEVLKDGQLSDWLEISTAAMQAEAYKNDGTLLNVALNFNTGTLLADRSIELFQNRPNPFRDATTIVFYLPQASPATITITDLSGRIIKVVQRNFAEGLNEVLLSKTDLDSKGVYFYRLETSDFVATRKMVFVE